MAEKEAWPGAGIDFPFEELQDHEVDRVFAYLESIESDEDKLKWIDRFFIECEYHEVYYLHPDNWKLVNTWKLRGRCEKLKTRIEQIAKLQAASKPTEEAKDDADTARRAMALYYLSLAANDGNTINKSALGRLLCFFTGQTPSGVKDYAQKPIGKRDENKNWMPKSKADREVVRALLADLGAMKAIDLMDRDEK